MPRSETASGEHALRRDVVDRCSRLNSRNPRAGRLMERKPDPLGSNASSLYGFSDTKPQFGLRGTVDVGDVDSTDDLLGGVDEYEGQRRAVLSLGDKCRQPVAEMLEVCVTTVCDVGSEEGTIGQFEGKQGGLVCQRQRFEPDLDRHV